MIKNKLLKYFLSIGIIILMFLHIIKIIFEGFDRDQLSIIPFLLIIVSIFIEKRPWYGFSFLSMGAVTIICLNNPSDLSAVPLLFIALLYYSKPLMISCISIIIPVLFILNEYLEPSGSITHIIEGVLFNYGFLTFLYFAVIRQPSKITHLSKVTPLDCRQLLILKYLSLDIPRKQIPDKVPIRELWKYDIEHFTLDIVNSEIAKIKKILDIKSEFSLGVWYNKKTEIPE